MKSVVVLGDIRVHFGGVGGTSLRSEVKTHGGAIMMHAAITSVIERNSDYWLPKLYSYEDDDPQICYSEGEEGRSLKGVIRWKKLSKRQPTGSDFERFRLNEPVNCGVMYLPPITAAFEDRLQEPTFLPDMVVIDDLGLQFGKLRFEIGQQSWSTGDQDCVRKQRATLENFDVDNLDESAARAELKRVRDACDEGTKSVLSNLFKRLYDHCDRLKHDGTAYPAQPAILVSLADEIVPLRRSGMLPQATKPVENYLVHLHSHKALARRTIVIMDASKLRDKISISSGLSWERTAQDAIVGLNKNDELRAYLKFGAIVIRFGRSAVLVLENASGSTISHRLYFNPEFDDRTWDHVTDGVVLGETSLLVASIVEMLDQHCRYRSGQAILGDIPSSLDDAMQIGITRMSNHYEIGYGNDEEKIPDCLTGFDPNCLAKRSEILSRQVLHTDGSDTHLLNSVPVQRIAVTPHRSRHWSILEQSSQADLNDLARRIVKKGPKVTLNTMDLPLWPFTEAWLDEAVHRLRLKHPPASNPAKFAPDSIELAELLRDSLEALHRTRDFVTRQIIGLQLHTELARFFRRLQIEEKFGEFADMVYRRISENWRWISKFLGDGVPNDLKSSGRHWAALQSCFSGDARDVTSKQIRSVFDVATSDETLPVNKRQQWEALRTEFANQGFTDIYIPLRQSLFEALEELETPHGWAHSIASPVLRLGVAPQPDEPDHRLLVVDRKEVESIRAVKRMIEQYVRDWDVYSKMAPTLPKAKSSAKKGGPPRPLSIAVFGPPGSGKSTAVNKVVDMMLEISKQIATKTINLSKLQSVDQLKEAMVLPESDRNALPIIFFDEFDSSLQDKELGWLRYFLSMMEDGQPMQHAIYVFAGGTSESFEEFSLADRSRLDPLWARFAERKGPDFTSRLSGHINVVGVNPSHPDDDLYLIRRALTLRFLLLQKQKLKDHEEVDIDEFMINALLHVPKYVHGTRSMRMLVDLCSKRDTKKISMSEVPPIHQLNMQVDGKAFTMLAAGQTKPAYSEPHVST